MLQYEWRPGIPFENDDINPAPPVPPEIPHPPLQHLDIPDPYFQPPDAPADQGAEEGYDQQARQEDENQNQNQNHEEEDPSVTIDGDLAEESNIHSRGDDNQEATTRDEGAQQRG